MYILLTFHDQECMMLNSIGLFDTIQGIMNHTKRVIRYSDIKKTKRIYKTSKSFFRILTVSPKDENLYFRYTPFKKV